MKGVLLASVSVLTLTTSAVAADLPVKAKPVEYVKVCSLYGAGFFYIPGTDICLKIGGYVRNQHYWNYGTNPTATPFFADGRNTRSSTDDNFYAIRFRTIVSFDTRQQTDFGTLRTYAVLGWTQDFIAATTSGLYANRAFIQFAGFTFGKASSYYDIYSAPAVSYFAYHASDTGDGGWGVAAYTAQLGNGISATISAEEARRTNVVNGNLSAIPLTGLNINSYGDFRFPDIVANIRLDQAWGSLQAMGALHDVSANYYSGVPGGGTTLAGHPNNEIGWAAGVGAIINTSFISPGDKFQFQFNYTEGAYRYVNHTQSSLSNANYFGSGNSLGFGIVSDAAYGVVDGVRSSLELTRVWGFNASYDHVWNPKWKTSVYGGWNKTEYNAAASDQVCRAFLLAPGTDPRCNPDWGFWFVGSRTQWNLTKDFYMGVDVLYSKLETSFEGHTVAFNPAGFRPVENYKFEDQDTVSVTFRVHRDFVP